MAKNGTSPLKVQRNSNGFITVLISAVCELFLIFLLFIDAGLSYMLTRFAYYCKLQTPCILCSRLDHVIGSEEPGFYCNLLCSNHKLEISSLLSCNIHGKLVAGRGMCENCFSSHIRENKSNLDTYRPFVGKSNLDLAGSGNSSSQSSVFDRDLSPASNGTRLCICCNQPWNPQVSSQRLVSLKSPGIASGKPNVPLPPRLSRQKCSKRIRNKFSSQAASHLLKETGFGSFSHPGYTEVKITSESESEPQFADDENFKNIVRDINGNKKESVVHCAPETLSERLSNVLATRKQPNASKAHNARCLAPHFLNENDVCESIDQLSDQESKLPELIALDHIPSSSCFVEVPSYSASLPADLTSNFTGVPVEPSPENLVDVNEASKHDNNDENLKLISRSTGAGFNSYLVGDDNAMVNSTDGELNAVNKSSVCGEKKEASWFVPKEPMAIYDNGVNQNIKSLSVQSLSGLEIPLSSNNSSPRFGCRSVELQKINEASYHGAQNTQNAFFKERNEFVVEPLDGNNLNEIEGEILVDRLNRQVEYDQKCMNALFKELEEERISSMIAVNEAMAMITRLQEEKATLHMDALQYLRMMEEQAEHDIDALEKANDLLAEKDKEIQDLEAELEYYRLNFPEEMSVEIVPVASSNVEKEHVSMENKNTSPIIDDFIREAEVIDNPVSQSSWSKFEDEKLCISQSLQNLERKFSRFTFQGISPFISDGEFIDEAAHGGQHQQEFLNAKDTQETGQVEKCSDLPMRKASCSSQERLNTSINGDLVVRNGTSNMFSEREKGYVASRENDLVVVKKEISDLNERVKAYETDFKFLQHSLNSLQNGNEGLLFVQEILHELQELRKLGLRSRNISVT